MDPGQGIASVGSPDQSPTAEGAITLDPSGHLSTRGALASVDDFATQARARVAPAVWDYIAGGAGEELTVRSNRAAFHRTTLRPRVLVDVSARETATTILGAPVAAPIGIAPIAYHGLVQPDGEVATVRAAGAAGLPVVVSTFSSRRLEDVARAATGPLWWQVYCFRDREVTAALVRRAEAAGFTAVVLTIDAPLIGHRERDIRNGFRLPAGVATANLTRPTPTAHGAEAGLELPRLAEQLVDATLSWRDIGWVRSISRLPLVLKGILTAEDATLAVAEGVDGIIVSNHGGRQVDGAVATLDALPEVVDAVAGAAEVYLDGGVRRGSDVLKALALGARAAFVGRPIMWALAAGGEPGVLMALRCLRDELDVTMALCGCVTVAQAGPALVRSGTQPATQPALAAAPARVDEANESEVESSRDAGIIDLGIGRPDAAFLSLDRFRRAATAALAGPLPTCLQYGPALGSPELRGRLADLLTRHYGTDVRPTELLITSGASHALDLVLARYTQPGDTVFVEDPTYFLGLNILRARGVRMVPIPTDQHGLEIEALERQLAVEVPKLIYTIPVFHNPTGVTLATQRRRRLVELAHEFGFLVVADEVYQLVAAPQRVPGPMRSFDSDRVLSLGSFSKILSPGARLGWIEARSGHLERLAHDAVLTSGGGVNPLAGAIVESVIGLGLQDEALRELRAGYDTRRLHMIEQLSNMLPASVRVTYPEGGYHLWLRLPPEVDATALADEAKAHGVAFLPGPVFSCQGHFKNCLRLCFIYHDSARLSLACERLAKLLHRRIPAAATTGGQ